MMDQSLIINGQWRGTEVKQTEKQAGEFLGKEKPTFQLYLSPARPLSMFWTYQI